MLDEIAKEPWLWGFLGAFVYAVPRASACFFAARDAKTPWARCIVDGMIALVIGPFAAEAVGPWVAHLVHDESLRELRAISAVIGLLANPAAPGVVEALSGRLLRRLKGTE